MAKQSTTYLRFLQAYLMALGEMPLPTMSVNELRQAIRVRLMEVTETEDAELPDNYTAMVAPVLIVNGVEKAERIAFFRSVLDLKGRKTSDPGRETLVNNLADAGKKFLSGDLLGGVGQLADLAGDLVASVFDDGDPLDGIL